MSTYPPKEAAGSYFERPAIIEKLRAESRGLPYRPAKQKRRIDRCSPSPYDAHRLFTVENGNRWMELARREPEAKMLLGELWHQGELCMLFADTNIGKSVLAVQIGESIARGESIAPFACHNEPSRVLYMDFELTRRQFGLRYSNGNEDYRFSDNFFRAEYNFLPDPPPNVDENELLIAAIEYKIKLVKANVLIIDNITCLRGGTENSAVALSLKKSLKALKNEHNLSILVLAHTPKRRNATKPISADDLHGSKLLVNFADSAFAIGKSTADSGLCYLKQIKQRNTRQCYGDDNVCLCRIQKPGTFLHFGFEGNSAERHHLLTRTATERRRLTDEIAALSAAGFSQREISGQLGIGLATVNRLLRGGYRCTGGDENTDMPMLGCANAEECAENAGAADKVFNAIPAPESTYSEENLSLSGYSEANIPSDDKLEDLTCGTWPETPQPKGTQQTKPPLKVDIDCGLKRAAMIGNEPSSGLPERVKQHRREKLIGEEAMNEAGRPSPPDPVPA